MRLAQFYRLVDDEFGADKSAWILHSHVLRVAGMSAAEALEHGLAPREVWAQLCEDFDVPEEQRLGRDDDRPM